MTPNEARLDMLQKPSGRAMKMPVVRLITVAYSGGGGLIVGPATQNAPTREGALAVRLVVDRRAEEGTR
jgi:hypothetical protein